MPYTHSFDTIATGLTVGMVVHPSLDEDGGGPARGRALAPPTLETLIARNGIFRLSLDNSNGRRLRWTVATAEGPVATAVGTTRLRCATVRPGRACLVLCCDPHVLRPILTPAHTQPRWSTWARSRRAPCKRR